MMDLEDKPVVPALVDVLCGTGHAKASHPGNERFRQIVEKYYTRYTKATSKTEKINMMRQVMNEVVSIGTRFLKKRAKSEEWYVADTRVGRDKISHFLRYMKRKRSCEFWPISYQQDTLSSTIIEKGLAPNAFRSGHCLFQEARKLQLLQMAGTRDVPPNLHFAPPSTVTSPQRLPTRRVHSEQYTNTTAGEQCSSLPSMNGIPTSSIPTVACAAAVESAQAYQHPQPTCRHFDNPDLLDFASIFGKEQQQDDYKKDISREAAQDQVDGIEDTDLFLRLQRSVIAEKLQEKEPQICYKPLRTSKQLYASSDCRPPIQSGRIAIMSQQPTNDRHWAMLISSFHDVIDAGVVTNTSNNNNDDLSNVISCLRRASPENPRQQGNEDRHQKGNQPTRSTTITEKNRVETLHYESAESEAAVFSKNQQDNVDSSGVFSNTGGYCSRCFERSLKASESERLDQLFDKQYYMCDE